jgi:hypothetical protein
MGILTMLVDHDSGADGPSLARFDQWLDEHPPAAQALFANPADALARP